MPNIAIIVAMDRNGIIGREGGLPWHLPNDLKHFKGITMGAPIIMGRRTHESVGRALPGRMNIVVSRNLAYAAPGCRVVSSLHEAMSAASPASCAFVIGGAALYREALPMADRMFVTEVDAVVEGDVRFPAFDRSQWREVTRKRHCADDNNAYAHSFVEWRRRPQQPEST